VRDLPLKPDGHFAVRRHRTFITNASGDGSAPFVMRGRHQPIAKTRSFDADLEGPPEWRMAGKAERDFAREGCNAFKPKRSGVVVDHHGHRVERRVKDSLVANALHHRIEGDVLDRHRAVRFCGVGCRRGPRHVGCVGKETTEGVCDA
jgi:hypothetical protein